MLLVLDQGAEDPFISEHLAHIVNAESIVIKFLLQYYCHSTSQSNDGISSKMTSGKRAVSISVSASIPLNNATIPKRSEFLTSGLIGFLLSSAIAMTLSFLIIGGWAQANGGEVNKIIGSIKDVRIVSGEENDVNFAAEGKGDARIISLGGNDFNNATFNQGDVSIYSGAGDDDNLVGINKGNTQLISGEGDDRNLVSRNEGTTRLISGSGNDKNIISDETSKGSSVFCGEGEDIVILVGGSDPKIFNDCEIIQEIQ